MRRTDHHGQQGRVDVALAQNRESHGAAYEKAKAGYIKVTTKQIEAYLTRLANGELLERAFIPTPPEDHTDDYYDDAIDMMTWSTDDKIELTQGQFRQYVKDDWGWKTSGSRPIPRTWRRDEQHRRVGALAVALGIGMASVIPALAADRSAGAGGAAMPTPDQFYLDATRYNFVGPLYPGETMRLRPSDDPMELWPLTGAGRVVWFFLGPSEVSGPGGAAWPNESVLKLSGLFDLTFDQSVASGVSILKQEIADRPGETLVIFGYSQGAIVANQVKQDLEDQYPNGDGPDIEFVLIGDPKCPTVALRPGSPASASRSSTSPSPRTRAD